MKKNSIERKLKINQLLWREVAQKSFSASVAFAVIATFVFFYHFNVSEFKILVQSGCVVVIFANALRLWVTRKVVTNSVFSKTDKNLIRAGVWLNALAWSVIFSFSAFETKFVGTDFVIINVIIAIYLASTIVTLAYDKTLFFSFHVLLIFPIMCLSIYFYKMGSFHNGWFVAIMYLIYFIYQIKQYKDYRTQLFERFGYQVDLEISYVELQNQTSQLVQASKITALGNMSGGLAHEVNNSLMVILTAVQQIERRLKQKHVEDLQLENKFQIVKNAGQKIKSVVQGLKYFSQQIDSPAKEIKKLEDIIRLTMTYCEELLKAHSIKIVISKIPDVKILCQPYQLVQILFNVIKNAYDAIHLENSSEKWIKIEFMEKDNIVFIKIKNSGKPIPPEVSEHLFQPFFSTKDVNKGTGLSLSISKGIAMDHSGDLEFDFSEQVTTFILKLPIVI